MNIPIDIWNVIIQFSCAIDSIYILSATEYKCAHRNHKYILKALQTAKSDFEKKQINSAANAIQ